jgi:uncharacterized glyoxalase superfamily protein PhnB
MPTIHPVVRYERAMEAIDWLCRAFGFEKQAVFPGPDDTVAHAELRFGTGTIGLSSAGPVDPGNVWTTVRDGVYVAIEGPDAHHDRAKAAGAVIERPPTDMDYGSREYTARDLDGHLWSFGTYAMDDRALPPVFYPSLRYQDGRAAMRFLIEAFGFTPGVIASAGEGQVRHAELWLDGSVLMVESGADPEHLWRGRSLSTNVLVSDPDAHYARATAAGVTIVHPLVDTSYGARGYLAQDPEGFLWNFSTYRPTPVPAAASGRRAP